MKTFTRYEMVDELRSMASQILSPQSNGKALFEQIADMLMSDAREGMVPAAELRPTIDIIKSLLLSADCSWYQSGGGHDWKGAVDVATSEIARLETLLGEKGGK